LIDRGHIFVQPERRGIFPQKKIGRSGKKYFENKKTIQNKWFKA